MRYDLVGLLIKHKLQIPVGAGAQQVWSFMSKFLTTVKELFCSSFPT